VYLYCMTYLESLSERAFESNRRTFISRICTLNGRYPYSVGRVLSELKTPALGPHRFDLLPNDAGFWEDQPPVPTDKSVWALAATWRVSPHLLCLYYGPDKFSADADSVTGDAFNVDTIRPLWARGWTLWEIAARIDADIRLSRYLAIPNERLTKLGEERLKQKYLSDLNKAGTVTKYAMAAGITRMTAYTRARSCGWYDQATPVVRRARAALTEGQSLSEAYTALGYVLPPVLVSRVADHAKAVGLAIVGGRLRKMPGTDDRKVSEL
jgi:hypothetical protein